MDPKLYCDVCNIFCGDAPGILLHMVSVEHNQAFQLHIRHLKKEGSASKEKKLGYHDTPGHQRRSNLVHQNLKETVSEESENYIDEKSSCYSRSIFSNKKEDILMSDENSVVCFPKKNSILVPKKCDSVIQVIVTGYSCSLETVWRSFSKFGCILTFHVIGGIVCITYLYMPSIDKFLYEAENNKIIVDKMEFSIILQILKPIKGLNVSNIPNSLKKMFSSGENFESKMEELMLETEFDPSEREKQDKVCSSVAKCLHDIFHPVAYPFGSRMTGLGTKASDLDLYLEITTPPKLVRQIKTTSNNNMKATLKDIVNQVGGLLLADKNFSNIVRIPYASTAIVKCVHKPTRISCDLSFQAPYGVFRTSLISFYLSLDHRIKPLLLFIRFWSKVHGFCGANKFHTYIMSMMVIFYLQQILILPSAATLINNAKEHERKVIDLWEFGFSEDVSLLPDIENTSTFHEVLKGFFHFYSKFDFRKYVISPYLGVAIDKRLFHQGLESEFPTQFSLYLFNCKRNGQKPLAVTSEICIQDFFVLNCNVASSLRCGKILHNFRGFCNVYALVIDSVYVNFLGSSNLEQMLIKKYQK